MDINLKNQFDNIESFCHEDANDHMNSTGSILNQQLNDTMNTYRDELNTKMASDLEVYKKELEDLYKDDPDKILDEMTKKEDILTAANKLLLDDRLKQEMSIIESKLNSTLSTKMGDIQSQLLNKLAAPFGNIGINLVGALQGQIGDIEGRLANIEKELGTKVAKKIMTRAERNGDFLPTALSGESLSSLTSVSETVSQTINQNRSKIESMVKDEALEKINELKAHSTNTMKDKLHARIGGSMERKIKNMLGSDIKWVE